MKIAKFSYAGFYSFIRGMYSKMSHPNCLSSWCIISPLECGILAFASSILQTTFIF